MVNNNLLALLALIAATLLFTLVYKHQDLFKDASSAKSGEYLVSGFGPGEFNRISITDKGRSTVLRKKGSRWQVISDVAAPAKLAYIEELFLKLKELKRGELISRQKEKHELFGVDGGRMEIRFTNSFNQQTAHFYLGKLSPDPAVIYFRNDDAQETQLIASHLRELFERRDWREYQLFASDPKQAVELKFEYDDGEFHLREKGGQWQPSKPTSKLLSLTAVNRLLELLGSLQIKEYLEKPAPEKSGLDTPQLTVTLVWSDGSRQSLLVGQEKDGDSYYASWGEEPVTFTLPKHKISNLKRELSNLR